MESGSAKPLGAIIWALLPLLLLGILVAWLLTGGLSPLGEPPVPQEALAVERTVFGPDHSIALHVRSTGADPVELTHLIVNGSVWDFTVSPEGQIRRLRTAVVSLPYHWVLGEPYHFEFITGNAVKFEHLVEAAVPTPGMDGRSLGALALLGLYVGVIPVYLGLVWYPFLRRLPTRGYHVLLAFTAGLLLFLAVDTLREGLEAALETPVALKAVPVFIIGLLGSLLGLVGIGRRFRHGGVDPRSLQGRLALGYLIAAGIGLHNLGEGLSIGAAYAIGEVAVGALLIIGFTIHNVTEGPAMVSPVVRDRVELRHLVTFGLIGGGPTIVGAWIGGYAFWPLLATLFFGIGAGAIIQVLYEIVRLMMAEGRDELASGPNLAGFFAGLGVMYLTGLLIAG